MKLWVDDVRTPPDESWQWASDAENALYLLRMFHVEELSLDHDLGDGASGYDIIKWIEKRFHEESVPPPASIVTHSANPVGVENIERAVKALHRAVLLAQAEEEEKSINQTQEDQEYMDEVLVRWKSIDRTQPEEGEHMLMPTWDGLTVHDSWEEKEYTLQDVIDTINMHNELPPAPSNADMHIERARRYSIWREPDACTEDYPRLIVHDGRVSGSITVGNTRLPLWAFAWTAITDGWDEAEASYEMSEYGYTAEDFARFIYCLLEQRGEFARLLCVLADVERFDTLDDESSDEGPWYWREDDRERVRAALQRCINVLAPRVPARPDTKEIESG